MNQISEIQESIDKAADWTSMICMKINYTKLKKMIISFTHGVNFTKSVPNIIIEGNPVEVVKHAKLIGVILSDYLSISCSKASFSVAANSQKGSRNGCNPSPP